MTTSGVREQADELAQRGEPVDADRLVGAELRQSRRSIGRRQPRLRHASTIQHWPGR